ncbi:hypothetical protein B296_00024684 [Ensete ventricosum]|uniref:Cupin type-1 domain-containing protein n=1 Tax=Ensete ventricosum TaxID=4639 RepID=A0A426XGD0_ENSVE|nr:hypothetical protein B296_00024684 [Ensete ventricosum]
MATSTSVFLSFSLCLLLLCHSSRAQLGLGQQGAGEPWMGARRYSRVSQCRFEKLSTLELTRRVPSEAGYTEYFDQYNEQLQCVGVALSPRRWSMVDAGRGIIGTVIPGCPETFQSFQQTEQQWEQVAGGCQRFRDEHQRIHYFREGDIIALPAGVAYWSYNNGEAAVVAITTFDTSSYANQLDYQHRNPDDRRGEIVLVTSGLQVLQASRQSEQLAREREVRQNIGDPLRADYFNPRAGRITTLNSQKLPILRYVQMSAVRALLRPVVGHRGRTVFVGELRQGQLLVVPQYFAVTLQAQRESFEWVSIKTNDNAIVSHFAGKTSALRGMPVEVLMNSYRISREEAMQLKFNRGNELALFTSKIEREAIRAPV